MPISFRIFQFLVIHTVKGFGIVNKAAEVGNLICASSAFSKTSLHIWKFVVHMAWRILNITLLACEFCQENTLVIANTLYQQHKRRWTWTSPDGHHQNQIDYIFCSQRWRSSIQSAKTRLGSDCGSNHELEKEMATHSSVLAWRIPGTGEPGGLPSMGSHRVGHDWSDLAAAAAADHELLIAKFRLKLKKVGKTTRPFRYDLKQIPYD